MIGPSAIGSENGTPTSITSAPASSSPDNSASVSSGDGWPAVTYGTSARRPDARSRANCSAMRSDEVVTDTNAVPIGLIRLDDCTLECSVLPAVCEIDKVAWEQDVAPRVADDPHDRPREHLGDRIPRVHESQLERVEHDERADRVNAREIDERLHQHGIHSAAGVVAHLFHDISRIERRRLIGTTRRRRVESISHGDDLAEPAPLP